MQEKELESNMEAKLKSFLNTWTHKYRFHLCATESENTFKAYFSYSDQANPLPLVTTTVFLQINPNDKDLTNLKFWFENDTLIHTLSSSIQFSEIERYIEIEMQNKLRVRKLYYLVNDFEFTRIKDVRSELLEE